MALTLRESYGLGLFSQEGCTAEEIKKKTKKKKRNVKHYKLNNKSFLPLCLKAIMFIFEMTLIS